jgi:hypothetical protein
LVHILPAGQLPFSDLSLCNSWHSNFYLKKTTHVYKENGLAGHRYYNLIWIKSLIGCEIL